MYPTVHVKISMHAHLYHKRWKNKALRGNTTGTHNTLQRRKIRLIESNAKCRLVRNLPVKGLCGRCLSVCPLPGYCLGWSSNFVGSESSQIQSVKLLQKMVSNWTQHPSPLPNHTHCLYLLCFDTGKGVGEPERRLEGQCSQSWVENTTWLTVPPVYKLW
jgi:hypothetical protein